MVIAFLIINITDSFFQKSGYFLIKPVVYGVVEDVKNLFIDDSYGDNSFFLFQVGRYFSDTR